MIPESKKKLIKEKVVKQIKLMMINTNQWNINDEKVKKSVECLFINGIFKFITYLREILVTQLKIEENVQKISRVKQINQHFRDEFLVLQIQSYFIKRFGLIKQQKVTSFKYFLKWKDSKQLTHLKDNLTKINKEINKNEDLWTDQDLELLIGQVRNTQYYKQLTKLWSQKQNNLGQPIIGIPQIGIPQINILLVGNQGVGKTSIINKYTSENQIHPSATKLQLKIKRLNFYSQNIALKIYDTNNQTPNQPLTNNIIKNSHVFLIVYDVTNRKTFQDTKIWLQQVKDNARQGALIMVIGNKNDLPNRQIQVQQGKKFADEKKILFFQISAKSSLKTIQVFEKIMFKIIPVYKPTLKSIMLEDNQKTDNKTKKGCF